MPYMWASRSFDGLCDFMSSGPLVLMVLEKENADCGPAQADGRNNPADAEEGTIRKKLPDRCLRMLYTARMEKRRRRLRLGMVCGYELI